MCLDRCVLAVWDFLAEPEEEEEAEDFQWLRRAFGGISRVTAHAGGKELCAELLVLVAVAVGAVVVVVVAAVVVVVVVAPALVVAAVVEA